MEGKHKGAEKKFLRDGPSDETAPSYPAAERFVKLRSPDPFTPARLSNRPFEQRAGK